MTDAPQKAAHLDTRQVSKMTELELVKLTKGMTLGGVKLLNDRCKEAHIAHSREQVNTLMEWGMTVDEAVKFVQDTSDHAQNYLLLTAHAFIHQTRMLKTEVRVREQALDKMHMKLFHKDLELATLRGTKAPCLPKDLRQVLTDSERADKESVTDSSQAVLKHGFVPW